jgi:thiol:disulfide interchange protein
MSEKVGGRLPTRAARKLALLAVVLAVPLQAADHVQWQLTAPASAAPGSKFLAKLTATIDPGWHLYSPTTPQPGPIRTTIRMRDDGLSLAGYRVFQPTPETQFDANFNRNTETYVHSAVFYIEIALKPDLGAAPLELAALPRYQVCSSNSCIPPVKRTASASVNIDKAAPAVSLAIPPGYAETFGPHDSVRTVRDDSDAAWLFLLTAFGFGTAAIFTPCVFPMIPITMSYFLNQGAGGTASRGQSIRQALLFCLGIVVLFSGLGMLATSLLGPFGIVQLGSNPWVNGLIAAIFIVFGLSLLGAYEITIPSFILSRLDSASRGGGTLGTLLMGLTFSLASFACVGPFVGPLLAASVTGGVWRPLAGMATFAAGLALPFFFLALFPSYLKKLPKSGGWLARVKVVMGFVILAAALKYLAGIDQVLQWGFLTRERFLAAWIVLFASAGLYLLGYLRLDGVGKDEPLGLGRLFSGLALVIFALSLVPGMFSGRLGELEGFVPPPTPGASLGGGADNQLVWLKNDLNAALAKARAENKRVLVNFTGYACTNCHWMKQNMFTRPEIAPVLHSMVLVDLYTDGEDAQSQANQQLEQSRFHTIAIPFYVIYDPGAAGAEAQVVATFPSLTRDTQEYLAFLDTPSPASPTAAPVHAEAQASVPPLDLPGVKTLDGAALDAGALSGKVVVANFWATWCVPCRREIPEFNKLQNALGPRGLQVLGISLDEDGADVIKPFLARNPMNYTVGLASEAVKNSYKLDKLPVTVVFDRRGQIVDRFEGFTEPGKIRGAVEKAL